MSLTPNTGFGIVVDYPGSAFTGVVIDLTPPEITCDDVDITHMRSSGGVREFMAGLIDSGVMKCTLMFNAAMALPVGGAGVGGGTGLAETTTITFPGGEIWTFKSYFNAYGPKTPLDDKMTVDCGLKVSGAITIT